MCILCNTNILLILIKLNNNVLESTYQRESVRIFDIACTPLSICELSLEILAS